MNDKFNETSNRFNWSFDNKYYPILIEKLPQGNVIFPLSKNSSMQVFKCDGDNGHYKFPTFAVLDASVIAQLYNFDYKWFEKQIDIADVNPDTMGDLNNVALMLISAYDFSSNQEFLDLAKRLYSRFHSSEIYCLINMLQIKVRETSLTESDVNTLNNIETDDTQTKFCICVLLGNKKDADNCLMSMSKEVKDGISKLPIMKLYSDMEIC